MYSFHGLFFKSKLLFLILWACVFIASSVHGQLTMATQQRIIVVSKKQFQVYVLEGKDTLCIFPCAVGKNFGNKTQRGDYRTPEGTFRVTQIQNSKYWTHDFKDGYGSRKGAYGNWFIRLHVPDFSGIGIHGTCFPESIGTRCTEGCVRLKNEDLEEFVKYVSVGMECVIESDY